VYPFSAARWRSSPFLLAADPPADRLVRLGLADLEVEVLGLGDGARPFRIAPAGPDAFVTLRGTGEVARIDVADLGCAPTLLDRLVGPKACTGGDAHGVVSDLDAADLYSLAEWLRTL
jgi:hypothetical protein